MKPANADSAPARLRRCRFVRYGRALPAVLLLALSAVQADAASRLAVDVRDPSGAPLADAVVAVEVGAPAHAPPGTRASIDQRDRRFAPGVIGIQTGTSVTFPNSDDVRHHVYSFSRPNDFQINLYHGEPSEDVIFEHSGIVSLGCNIHDGMVGYIAVVDTPHVATTDADGKLVLTGLPAGRHRLQLWHPDAGWSESTVLIGAEGGTVTRSLVAVTSPGAPAAANPLQQLFAD